MVLMTIHRNIFSFALLIFVSVFLSCSDKISSPDGRIVSLNAQTSNCGGYIPLAKRSQRSNYVTPEDTIPCLEETLFWRYDTSSHVLALLRRHISANCAAKLSMYVARKENTLIVNQNDARDPNMGADCDCVFDTYCEVPEISGQSVTIAIDSFSMTLALKEQKGKCILYPLKYFVVGNGKFANLSFLSQYPQLQSLQIFDVDSFSDLSPIGRLPNLTSFTGYNVDSIGFLAPCSKLEYLNIWVTQRCSDISSIQGMAKLTSLDIRGASSVRDITPIGRCSNLTYLSLTDCSIVVDIAPLSACTSLTNLTLSNCPEVVDISSLAKLTKLKNLSLHSIPLIPTLQPLAGLVDLASLTLDSLTAIASLEPLRSLTKLEDLTISNNHLIIDISPLATMSAIKTLVLQNDPAINDFSPLVSCLDSGDFLAHPGTPIPQAILDQLKKKNVAYKGDIKEK
jgi:hypothetical protein